MDYQTHSGTNHTLLLISLKYWIISAREEIIELEKECLVCKRKKAKKAQQIMAPLPLHRLTTSMRAFTRTAVDYIGPFITIQGRGKRRKTLYVLIYMPDIPSCSFRNGLWSRDVDSFMKAFYRMANRRGLPEEMLSDNGKNFVAADRVS